MRPIRKICVVTGSRADYGLLYWVMREIQETSDMELKIIVTGPHLSKKSGYTVDNIVSDGFEDVIRIKTFQEDTTPNGISESIGHGIIQFSNFFKNNEIDFLVLLGDRFEILSVAIASLPFNIPICHLGGGEVSEGAIDDSIRHSITKMSHLHFPINETCAARIKQMGEEPERIFTVGSTSLDFINHYTLLNKKQLSNKLNIEFNKKVMLVVYHPTTLLYEDVNFEIDNLLSVIDKLKYETVLIYPNIDTSSDVIVDKLIAFSNNRAYIKIFKGFDRITFLSLMNTVDVMVGNSSSGIVESPTFKLPVVNIGRRQQGRDHVGNIINVGTSINEIESGIYQALNDEKFIKGLSDVVNPNGDGNASKRIVKILSELDLETFSIIKKSSFQVNNETLF